LCNKDYTYQGLVEYGLDISLTCGKRIRAINDLWNKDLIYQGFWMFNQLRYTITDIKLWNFLRVYVDEATLRHVHIQGRNTTQKAMTCTFL